MESREDLQRAIDFLGTPLIVDTLRLIRDGQRPRQNQDLSRYGDAVDAAVDALADAGVVQGRATDRQLTLTTKGRLVCSLVDDVIHFNVAGADALPKPISGQRS